MLATSILNLLKDASPQNYRATPKGATLKTRLDYSKALPNGLRVVNAMDAYSQTSGLEPSLLDLIKLRASQINGCAYCVDMRTKDARTGGETEQRLYNLTVWRETPNFSASSACDRSCRARSTLSSFFTDTAATRNGATGLAPAPTG